MRLAFLSLVAAVLAFAAPVRAATPTYHEFIEGNPNAKVTVIEYASLTCPHCAHFYLEGFPQLKKAYIDTGRIKFVFRDLPTAPQDLALAAAALARCAPNDRGMELVGLLYKNQEEWEKDPETGLRHYASLAGLNKTDFDACLKNDAIFSELQRVAMTAMTLYKIPGTPTFLVNEEMVDSGDFPSLSKAIDAALAKNK